MFTIRIVGVNDLAKRLGVPIKFQDIGIWSRDYQDPFNLYDAQYDYPQSPTPGVAGILPATEGMELQYAGASGRGGNQTFLGGWVLHASQGWIAYTLGVDFPIDRPYGSPVTPKDEDVWEWNIATGSLTLVGAALLIAITGIKADPNPVGQGAILTLTIGLDISASFRGFLTAALMQPPMYANSLSVVISPPMQFSPGHVEWELDIPVSKDNIPGENRIDAFVMEQSGVKALAQGRGAVEVFSTHVVLPEPEPLPLPELLPEEGPPIPYGVAPDIWIADQLEGEGIVPQAAVDLLADQLAGLPINGLYFEITQPWVVELYFVAPGEPMPEPGPVPTEPLPVPTPAPTPAPTPTEPMPDNSTLPTPLPVPIPKPTPAPTEPVPGGASRTALVVGGGLALTALGALLMGKRKG